MAGSLDPRTTRRIQMRQVLARRQDAFTSVAWSPDGRWLASGSDDRAVRIWEAKAGKSVRCLELHQARVTSVAFSPDGRWLASGSKDRTVCIWERETGRVVRVLKGHRNDRIPLALPMESLGLPLNE